MVAPMAAVEARAITPLTAMGQAALSESSGALAVRSHQQTRGMSKCGAINNPAQS